MLQYDLMKVENFRPYKQYLCVQLCILYKYMREPISKAREPTKASMPEWQTFHRLIAILPCIRVCACLHHNWNAQRAYIFACYAVLCSAGNDAHILNDCWRSAMAARMPYGNITVVIVVGAHALTMKQTFHVANLDRLLRTHRQRRRRNKMHMNEFEILTTNFVAPSPFFLIE